MKKVFEILLSLAIIICFVACSNSDTTKNDNYSEGKDVTEQTSQKTSQSTQETLNNPYEQAKVFFYDEDVTDKLEKSIIDGVLYAEVSSFIDAFAIDGYTRYYYEFSDTSYSISIISYATDVVLFKMYTNLTTAEKLVDALEDEYEEVELDSPLLYDEDGTVWIPLEAFNALNSNVVVNCSSSSKLDNSIDQFEILSNALGKNIEGKMIVETGDEEINGEMCKLFSVGTDSQEKFMAEQHFAVSPNGDIYYIDILQGADWIPYALKK